MKKPKLIYDNDARHHLLYRYGPPLTDYLLRQPVDEILGTSVDTLFNRAIIFDTTQRSYHGLPTPLSCPDDCYRKSLAVYYLTDAPENCPTNSKAIYIPTKEQEDDKEIQEIIEKRSRMTTAKQVYQI